MKFHVPDMSCGHCTQAITKSVKASDPSAQVETDLDAHTVSVESTSPVADIQQAIKSAGYDAAPL